jgi:hypothetical protein
MLIVSLVIVFLLLLGTSCVNHETQSLFAWNTWVGKMMLLTIQVAHTRMDREGKDDGYK